MGGSGGRRLDEIAARVGGEVVGDGALEVRGVATLEAAGEHDLAFLTNPKYRAQAERTAAGAVLVDPNTELPGRNLLVAPHPYVALAEILALFHPEAPRRPGVSSDARVAPGAVLGEEVEIGPFAVVEDGATVGDRATIGAGCYVGRGARVGDGTVLMPRVVLYAGTRVGERCIVHAGVVLGADGFGFAPTPSGHRKIPQVGRVVIEDDVEIGANSAVDRGTIGDTVVGAGSKIDDLVMVAHGVRLGRGCLLVAQSGIAGSTVVGDRFTIAGQSGVSGHVRIGDDCVVAAKSAVFEDLPDRSFVGGVPAQDHRAWRRVQAVQKRLPDLRNEVRRLGERLAALEARLDEEE